MTGQTKKVFRFHGHEIQLELWPERVFVPTTTSETIAEILRIEPGETAIDLGCGTGFFSVLMAVMGAKRVYALDLQPDACELTERNAKLNRVEGQIDCRRGFLFAPLSGETADLIVNDVSGVVDALARTSGWFPAPVPGGGPDGAEAVVQIFDPAQKHLNPSGRLIFPVLSLSNEDRIMQAAHAAFNDVRLVAERVLPLPSTVTTKGSVFFRLLESGQIRAHQRGSRWLWNLRVFEARRTIPS